MPLQSLCYSPKKCIYSYTWKGKSFSISLSGNAIKFTEKGEVVVFASVENRSADSIELKFSVKDTGNTSGYKSTMWNQAFLLFSPVFLVQPFSFTWFCRPRHSS